MKKIEEKITKLLGVTARLSKILKTENELLATNVRGNSIKPLQEEKIALSNVYEQQLKIISSEEDLPNIDPGLANRLQDAVTSFGLLLEENALRLKAKMDAGEHLFRIISEFFREPDAHLGYFFNLVSMGTILSVIMMIVGAIFLVKKNDFK